MLLLLLLQCRSQNAPLPLKPPQGQLLVLLLNVRLTRRHCAANPGMLSAVAAVHTRLVRPAGAGALRLLGPAAAKAATSTSDAGASAAALCAYYLPGLQFGLGLLLPAALVYRYERGLRGWVGGAGAGAALGGVGGLG